MAADLSICPR